MMDQEAFKWLDENQLSYDIWDKKYRYNNETFQDWLNRVSAFNEEIRELIYNKKFLFGGRTLANRGTNRGSYSNCYSSGFVQDSLEDILNVNTNIALTFKAQGGQGLSLSKIRPKGCLINNEFESDGIIPFMEMYNKTTESIMQGGSRKGALLMSLDIWHAEAEDFIKIKSDLGKINKANLSLEIDNNFMTKVKNFYDGTNPDVNYKINRGHFYENNIITYGVYPVKLYKTMCEHAHKYAEPGIIFTDAFRNYNIMEHVQDYQIETCNPCGEQPLPKHGACNLSSINLSEYIVNPFTEEAFFDYETLKKDIPYIVKAMDEIIDENADNHALVEQKAMAKKYRNIGIGIMGLADAFVKMKYKYGSDESVLFTREVMQFIFKQSVIASAELGKELGNFPGYDSKVWDSTIIENHFNYNEVLELKQSDCLRNCSLISIAPTGSIGTMLNVSTGCEPFFMLQYQRNTKSLNKEEKSYTVNIKALDEYFKVTNTTEIPEYFVTSAEIPWKERIHIQSALQYSTDTAISSTINLPKTTTKEEIELLFLAAWEEKLKGITIYVDGSRDPILSRVGEIPKEIQGTIAPKRPKKLKAHYYPVKVKGESFIIMIGMYEDKPYEIFAFKDTTEFKCKDHDGYLIKKAKGHYMFESDCCTIPKIEVEAIEARTSIYLSMLLRHGVDIKQIIKTAKKVNPGITSFTSAIVRVLSKYVEDEVSTEVCPDCGNNLIRTGGCLSCPSCGYSKCG